MPPMKFLLPVIASILLSLVISCDNTVVKSVNSITGPKSSATPKDGNYDGKGKITKIDLKLLSVEMEHGEIAGLMPAMKMEFYVLDKAMLEGLAVGDMVDFTIL